MKKVTAILTTIAVVAAVSGAVAFKAHKFNGSYYCSTASGTGTNCGTNAGNSNRYTTGGSLSLYCIQNPSGPDLACPTTTTSGLQQNN